MGVRMEEDQGLANLETEPMALEEEGQEAEPDAEAKEPDDGRAWYVIHSYSGYENKVKTNLEQRIDSMEMQDQIFQVVIPTEEEIEIHDGKRRTVERRVFPGYLLVHMIMNNDSWYVVRNTPGVTGFAGMGNEPTPLRDDEVEAIMRRIESQAPRVIVTFEYGERVRIIDGPFTDFVGTVDGIFMDKNRVRVMVSFFGRETPVELDFLQVEKV
jgi:transcriptional antiterminator NusG